MIAVLDPSELRSDLTPVATAAQAFFTWLPDPWGLVLIVAAAIAAFASTGNAGILSASRYPLAMARDGLVTPRLGALGRFGTPIPAIVVTAALMVLAIVALDVEGIAKLASAFQLLLFGLLNVAVIVMRESRIASYVPGYRSPLYPWMQIAGIVVPFVLVAQLGLFAFGASVAIVVGRRGVVPLLRVAQPGRRARGGDLPPVRAAGAAPLRGARRRAPDDPEGQGAAVTRRRSSTWSRAPPSWTWPATTPRRARPRRSRRSPGEAAQALADRAGLDRTELVQGFLDGSRTGSTPVSHGAALPHLRLAEVDRPELVLVRARAG